MVPGAAQAKPLNGTFFDAKRWLLDCLCGFRLRLQRIAQRRILQVRPAS
jgi:hypothetical protein